MDQSAPFEHSSDPRMRSASRNEAPVPPSLDRTLALTASVLYSPRDLVFAFCKDLVSFVHFAWAGRSKGGAHDTPNPHSFLRFPCAAPHGYNAVSASEHGRRDRNVHGLWS